MDSTKITPENAPGKKEKNQNIQVFVRVRPMNSQENAKSSTQVIDTPGSREVVVRERAVACVTKTFTFDKVFGPKSKQIDVYKSVVAPLLAEVLLGYNCTVFAYGQTGTGKTFTMEGERSVKTGNVDIDPQAGILPRALSQLFDEVRLMNCEFTVRVSFLELYNEELFDLLAPIEESKTKTLRIFEDTHRKGSVIIQGLEEVIVNNKQEVYAVLDKGSQQRKTAATLMNASSSRSHTIFTITVHLKESSVEGEEMLKIGKLHLVDLAGSENIGKSGAVDKRAREAGSINQSLLTLGRVISALVERTPHVPYRESKLTRLLQDSLGGKTKTSIIATVSPASTNIEETLSTLDYAHRAKNIMNKPEVNQKLTKKEALNIYTDEIERLRRDLNATRDKNGIFMDTDNYNRTMCQIQAQHVELNEKSNRIKELEELVAEKEEAERESVLMMDELRVDLQIKQVMLDEAKSLQQKMHKKILNEEKRADELKYLVKYHLEAEEKITGEASALLSTASDSVSVIESLHSRLDRKQTIEDRNCANAHRFREEFKRSMDEIIGLVGDLREGHTLSISDIRDKFDTRSSERQKLLEAFSMVLNTTCSALDTLNTDMLQCVGKHVSHVESRSSEANKAVFTHCNVAEATLKGHMKTVVGCVESLRMLFESLLMENRKLEESLSEKFAKMSSEVKNTINSTSTTFERLDTVLKEMERKWRDVHADGMAGFNTFTVTQNKYKEESNNKIDKMQQQLQNLQSMLEQLKTDRNETLEKSEEAFKAHISNLNVAQQVTAPVLSHSCDSISDVKLQTDALKKQLRNFKQVNVNEHKNVLHRVNQKLTTELQTLMHLEETAKAVLSDGKSTLVHVTQSLEENQQQLLLDLKNLTNEMRQGIQNHGHEATFLKNHCYSAVKAINDSEEKHLEQMLTVINTQCDHVSTSASKVNSMLQQTTGNVDEFWEETYLVDSPTGGTPMRRKYDLPAKLTLPSPHDRVMARYRAVSREIQLAIEDCAKGGDDLDCSWSANYFKNLDIPVAVTGTEENQVKEIRSEGEGNLENENSDFRASTENKLETIEEYVEPEPESMKENSVESEVSSVSSDEVCTPTLTKVHNSHIRLPTTGAKKFDKYKQTAKSRGKKAVLKPPN